jgi:uncharacterized membrane protein
MSSNAKGTPVRKWADYLPWLGVLITIGPALGYSLAFLRELGFCQFFKIPVSFIRLDITNTLIAVGEGLGLLVIALFALALWYQMESAQQAKKVGSMQRRVFWWYWIFVFMLYLGLISGAYIYISLEVSAALSTFFVLFDLIIDLLVATLRFLKAIDLVLAIYRFIKTNYLVLAVYKFIKAKVWRRKPVEPAKPIPEDLSTGLLPQPYSRWAFTVVVVALVVFGGTWAASTMQAENQKDFFVPSTSPNSVVLKIYGDNLICAPFNGKTVEPSFFVLKVNDESRPVLELKRVGPLTPANVMPEGNTTIQYSGNVTLR